MLILDAVFVSLKGAASIIAAVFLPFFVLMLMVVIAQFIIRLFAW